MGPEKHVVFYPVRNKTEYNLVLMQVHPLSATWRMDLLTALISEPLSCPDTLPNGTRTSQGSLEELADNFNGWDPA
jgi:salicylate hydroxylase